MFILLYPCSSVLRKQLPPLSLVTTPLLLYNSPVYSPDSASSALLLLFLSLLFWGSWPNTFKLAPRWPLELFYWDYSFGMLASMLLLSLTLGTLFGPPTVWQNLATADTSALLYAFAAGFIWNIGNILLIVAVALVGLAVAFPIGVGLALILGVVSSYFLQPRGNATLLALGVLAVFAAILFNALAFRTLSATRAHSNRSGLWLAVAAGILIAVPGPLVTKAFAAPQPLASYGITLVFTCGAFLLSLIALPIMMRRPVSGQPLTLHEFALGAPREHAAGLLGALFWALGTSFNYTGAQFTGVPLAFAIGQANPLVAALWGVFVWREFRGAPRRAHWLLAAMFALYLLGLLLLSRSADTSSLSP